MDVLSMEWRDVLVASWPVDPDTVAQRLPDGVTVDTFDGRAWLSVVPFVMGDVRPLGVPAAVGRTFGELNLRTYVTGDAGPGIYFFNLDADDTVGVTLARTLFKLPYYHAEMRVHRDGDSVDFRSHRVHEGVPPLDFDATYRPIGDPEPAEPGTFESFLLERYRFYVEGRSTLYAGEVSHDPWRIAHADATFRTNDLFTANGFETPDSGPHLLYSPGVDVTAERVHRV
ncbi:MAG: YqjF family protein [Halobacterium sp.]